MLPRSTHQRTQREQRWPKGRTQEISRPIGRSLRMGVNLEVLGERQVIVDCAVLQAMAARARRLSAVARWRFN